MNLKPILGMPHYFAGDDGHIYSDVKRTRGGGGEVSCEPYPVHEIQDKSGYWQVSVKVGGKWQTRTVAPLVCSAFYGTRPSRMECCHGARGKGDNRPDNIEWGTRQKNQGIDKVRDGTGRRGEKNHFAKITRGIVWDIRDMDGFFSNAEIAKALGVGVHVVYSVLTGRAWSWLGPRPHNCPSRVRLTPSDWILFSQIEEIES
jgi:hypothetical protein